jgi:DUF1365 family protein
VPTAAPEPRSRVYRGRVTHRRLGKVDNRFRYGLFMLYLDLAELPSLFDRFWLWSARRPALARFHRADYLGDPARPLADCVRDRIREELGWAPDGPIRLLTHLRYFGYCFNPVSFYYCFDADGQLQVIVAEITNTPWDERHSYVLQARPGAGVQRFAFAKQFHVSPFMPMEQQYHWHFSEPGERLAVYMENRQDGRRLFDAALELQAAPVTGGSLARALLRFPAMTAVVAWRIYWQALRLLLKKAVFHPHPAGTRKGA